MIMCYICSGRGKAEWICVCVQECIYMYMHVCEWRPEVDLKLLLPGTPIFDLAGWLANKPKRSTSFHFCRTDKEGAYMNILLYLTVSWNQIRSLHFWNVLIPFLFLWGMRGTSDQKQHRGKGGIFHFIAYSSSLKEVKTRTKDRNLKAGLLADQRPHLQPKNVQQEPWRMLLASQLAILQSFNIFK